jgi:predicted AlkP superfamily pyrophosphatase or phosphodiesterase
MHRTVVLDVVGLSAGLLGPDTPCLNRLAKGGGSRHLKTILPAVTCSVQATFTTGALPRQHGSVGNGWYFRDLAEVWLWRQSNHLVSGEKIWEAAQKRDASFSCAKLFWWYNMYSSADFSVTPRPIYRADGLKLPDIYTHPASLREELTQKLGPFPLFDFWGPKAGLPSSQWIADCGKHVYDARKPTLTLLYLPHLDYDFQRYGPDHPKSRQSLREVDALCGELLEHFQRDGARVVVLSEYGITPVAGPVHINRVLRGQGLLATRVEEGTEKLDAGASEAFAVADHQISHVYVRRPERVAEVKRLLEKTEGIGKVLDGEGKRAFGLDHPRSGELVALCTPDRWFSYYYWLDDAAAPDFARTVDIHRKPGYDPAELFIDPGLRAPKAKLAFTLLKKKLGFRYLMDVIPLGGELVRGSHGLIPARKEDAPVVMSTHPELLPEGEVPATAIKGIVLDHLFAAASGARAAEKRAS